MDTEGLGTREGLPSKQCAFDLDYDFSFRPASYWPDAPSAEALLSRIPGTQRRDIASRALQGEELPRLGGDELYREAMEFVLEEKLTDDELESWGRIHPSLMGGEYLPELHEGEVEIARIELRSTTGDVVQVLARPAAAGFSQYRVVDEYWDEGSRYAVTPESSGRPLTFGELVELIDTVEQADEGHKYQDPRFNVGHDDRYRDLNYYEGEIEAEELLDFVSVGSVFYPALGAYYNERASAWVEEKRQEPRRPPRPQYPTTPEEIAVAVEAREAALVEWIHAFDVVVDAGGAVAQRMAERLDRSAAEHRNSKPITSPAGRADCSRRVGLHALVLNPLVRGHF